ncbi:MAG: hypothetical protein H6Q86_3499 [candidate division NC10 bacterium]|nr:hypothetical protein [candidate division NC10 bacterium]
MQKAAVSGWHAGRLDAVAFGLVGLPLADQPRLDKSAEEPFPHYGRLHLQARQEFGKLVHGEVHPLGEVHERQGVSRLGWSFAGLGHLGLEFRQQIGGHFRAFNGFRDAVEEPGLEGVGRFRHTMRHAMGCRAVDRGAAYRCGL